MPKGTRTQNDSKLSKNPTASYKQPYSINALCVMHALLTPFPAEKEKKWRTAQRKTSLSVLSNPLFTLRQHEHDQALFLLTCIEKERVDWDTGKAQKRVNV